MKSRTLDPNFRGSRPNLGLPLPNFQNEPTSGEIRVQQPADAGELRNTESVESQTQQTNPVISVDLIDPNPIPPRSLYTDELIAQRAQELRTYGQINLIHVRPNPDAPGRFIIIDGWTRVLACQRHRVLETLESTIHQDLSTRDAAWLGWISNETREGHTDFDRALFFEQIIAEGTSPAEVCKRAGVQQSTMSMYRAFAKLPDEILSLVRANPTKFSHRVAYELLRIFEATDLKKANAIALKFAVEDLPHKWLLNQSNSLISKKSKTSHPNKKVLRFSNGVLKHQDGQFDLSLKVAPELQDNFSRELEDLLKRYTTTDPDPAQDPSVVIDA